MARRRNPKPPAPSWGVGVIVEGELHVADAIDHADGMRTMIGAVPKSTRLAAWCIVEESLPAFFFWVDALRDAGWTVFNIPACEAMHLLAADYDVSALRG